MYVYILKFDDKKAFLDIEKLPDNVIIVAEEGGLGEIPITLELIDIKTDISTIEITGHEKGYFVNVFSVEPLPQLEKYIINPLPVALKNKLSGQYDEMIVEPP
jgi:hypothetical protein